MTSQTAVGESSIAQITATGDCEIAPSVSLSLLDAINRGTTISLSSAKTIVNGKFIGNTAFASKTYEFGDKVQFVYNKSDYIDEISETVTVKCGSNSLSGDLYATDTATFSVFNNDGNKVTDGTGAVATWQAGSTSPINMEVRVESKSDQSTGDLIVVIESSNTTQVDDLTLSPATEVDVPEFYAVAGAGSIAKAYKVAALKDGEAKSFTLNLNPESGVGIGDSASEGNNTIYMTAYSEQAYVDTDGSFKVGIENSDGTIAYEDTWDYDWVIAP